MVAAPIQQNVRVAMNSARRKHRQTERKQREKEGERGGKRERERKRKKENAMERKSKESAARIVRTRKTKSCRRNAEQRRG